MILCVCLIRFDTRNHTHSLSLKIKETTFIVKLRSKNKRNAGSDTCMTGCTVGADSAVAGAVDGMATTSNHTVHSCHMTVATG